MGSKRVSSRPNIVFITIDAWRYDGLGAAPDKGWLETYNLLSRLRTPNLDRFASGSLLFTQAVATAPHTTVSHASIMTGLFPPQHGVRSFMYERLPENIKTLAEILQNQGYRTVTLREAESSAEPGILQKVDVLRGFETTINSLEQLVRAGHRANDDEQPVFAFLHLWDLHAPYLYSNWAARSGALEAAWPKLQALADRRQIALPEMAAVTEHSMMAFQRALASVIDDVDQRTQLLFKWYIDGLNWFDQYRWPAVETALKAAGLWQNTILFVYGDHGEGVHEDGHENKVFEHGQSLLDDVLRVPLLIHGLPDIEPALIGDQVSLVDMAATVLDFLGADFAKSLTSQGFAAPHGRSLLPLAYRSQQIGWPPIHFAELSTAGPNFTLALPSPQFLYQSCARIAGMKVLYHRDPIHMKRYLNTQARLQNLHRRVRRKLAASQDGPRTDLAGKGSWYWTDLRSDAHERRPRRWRHDAPGAAAVLRSALEALYQDSRRGPPIELAGFKESAVLERLYALGYVES